MRPLFTVHVGELLFGQYIERKFRNKNVWVPAKDTGVDLLVTNAKNTKTVSFQVKFSRDFLPIMQVTPIMRRGLRACSWFTLNRRKIIRSTADYWIFVLMGFDEHSVDFAIVRPAELIKRLDRLERSRKGPLQVYLWVTTRGRCWLTRGLKRPEQDQIAQETYGNKDRDFTRYLEDRSMLKSL
jgi:hypothetical protein